MEKINIKMDVLDELQEVDDFVRLVLKSGEIVFGEPDCICYDEDEDGFETVKIIKFLPWGSVNSVFFGLDEVESFEPCNKEDIPPYE